LHYNDIAIKKQNPKTAINKKPSKMIKKLLYSLLLVFLLSNSYSQTTIYVSPTGSGNGATEATAASVYTAFDYAMGPGTTIVFLDGTYNLVADIYLWNRSGTAEAPIVIKAKNKHMAVLKGNNEYSSSRYGVFFVAGGKHIVVDGLTVMHEDNSLDQQYGINVSTAVGAGANGSNVQAEYVTIKNCKVYGHGAGGISSADSDHITFENNIVYGNCSRSALNTSGISLYKPTALTSDSDYWSVIIRGNTVYNNVCTLPFYYNEGGVIYQSPNPTDGNGIMLDLFDNDYGRPKYGKRILIENNVCYKNGGSGIKSYKTSLARIINNTVYHNNTVLNQYGVSGEIFVFETGGVNGVYNEGIYNNVVVADPELTTNEDYAMIVDFDMDKVYNNFIIGKGAKFNNYTYDENTFATGNTFKAKTDQDAAKFQDAANRNFSLKSISPLIGADTQPWGASTDINGVSRPQGTYSDIGAYEYVYSTATLSVTPSTATLNVSETTQLTASETVTWSSSDTSKATVNSSGLVTAVAAGSATITATTSDNRTSTSVITINVPVTAITVTPATVSIVAGNISQLTASETSTWTSSDITKATVSSTGLVTTIASGTVTITATASGNRTATSTFTITAPASSTTCGVINNFGFETGNLSSWNNTGGFANVTTDAKSGTTAAVITGNGNFYYNSQISVTAGHKLGFSFWAKVANNPSSAQVGIDYLNSAGTTLGNEVFNVSQTTYTKFSSSRIPPAGTVKVQIWSIKGSAAGQFYMDDFCLLQTNNCGLISNNSFENDFTSWTNSSTAASIGTAAQSRSGNKCAVLNKTSGLSSASINVNAANKLNFEVYAKIETSPTTPQIGIDYRNAAGTKLGSDVFAINTTTYKLYSISKTLPTGTTKVNIWTYKGSTAGKIYIDDFCMTNAAASARESGEEEEMVLEDDLLNNFKVYPNPASSSVTVSVLDKNETSMTIQIIDLIGKQVLDRTIDLNPGQDNVELNIQNFMPGNYFVKVSQGYKQKTSKLIKE
jgi:uncharacterized protein YjdB